MSLTKTRRGGNHGLSSADLDKLVSETVTIAEHNQHASATVEDLNEKLVGSLNNLSAQVDQVVSQFKLSTEQQAPLKETIANRSAYLSAKIKGGARIL